jgi:hypothetical protein
MPLPSIHLNGTSKERLVAALCDASDALNVALDKMRQTAPNGRDYYRQGPEALERADAEHMDRMRRVAAVKDEVDALTIAINEGGYKK